MMHEWYELTIAQVIEMSTEEFLELCSRYLVENLEEEQQRDIDRQAAAYACEYLGVCEDADSLYRST